MRAERTMTITKFAKIPMPADFPGGVVYSGFAKSKRGVVYDFLFLGCHAQGYTVGIEGGGKWRLGRDVTPPPSLKAAILDRIAAAKGDRE